MDHAEEEEDAFNSSPQSRSNSGGIGIIGEEGTTAFNSSSMTNNTHTVTATTTNGGRQKGIDLSPSLSSSLRQCGECLSEPRTTAAILAVDEDVLPLPSSYSSDDPSTHSPPPPPSSSSSWTLSWSRRHCNNSSKNSKKRTTCVAYSSSKHHSNDDDNVKELMWLGPTKIAFRPIRPSDKYTIQKLHEEWFPVRYKDEFYSELVHNRMVGSGEQLFSCVATTCNKYENEEEDDDDEDEQGDVVVHDFFANNGGGSAKREQWEENIDKFQKDMEGNNMTWDRLLEALGVVGRQPRSNGTTSSSLKEEEMIVSATSSTLSVCNSGRGITIEHLDDDDHDDEETAACVLDAVECGRRNERKTTTNGAFGGGEEGRIIGCIVGAFVETNKCSRETTSLLVPNPERHTRMFYIMTLGTVMEYRQRGLATILVNRCIKLAEEDAQCGVLYLHVITYNDAAIRFYEKLGFSRVQEIEDYYTIKGKHYNCFLYAKYFHGNRGHRTILRILSNVVSRLWKSIAEPVYSALKGNENQYQS